MISVHVHFLEGGDVDKGFVCLPRGWIGTDPSLANEALKTALECSGTASRA